VLHGLIHSSPGELDVPLPASYRYILEQAPSTPVRIVVPLSKLLDLNRQDHQHYILEQAASVLSLPLPALLDISNRQRHFHKRARYNTAMPPSVTYPQAPALPDSQEKSPLAGPSTRVVDTGRRVFTSMAEGFPGWTSARLSDCLATFSMCPPPSTYDTGMWRALLSRSVATS